MKKTFTQWLLEQEKESVNLNKSLSIKDFLETNEKSILTKHYNKNFIGIFSDKYNSGNDTYTKYSDSVEIHLSLKFTDKNKDILKNTESITKVKYFIGRGRTDDMYEINTDSKGKKSFNYDEPEYYTSTILLDIEEGDNVDNAVSVISADIESFIKMVVSKSCDYNV